jgi:acetylornithine aminotransferase
MAVLEVIEKEELIKNAAVLGSSLIEKLKSFTSILEVRGRGLMIGFDLPEKLSNLRKDLLFKHHIFTGDAKPNTIRLLPSLALLESETAVLLTALDKELQ